MYLIYKNNLSFYYNFKIIIKKKYKFKNHSYLILFIKIFYIFFNLTIINNIKLMIINIYNYFFNINFIKKKSLKTYII